MNNSDKHSEELTAETVYKGRVDIETVCPAPDCENVLFLRTDVFVNQDTVTCYGCGRELTLTLSAKVAGDDDE